MPVSLAAMVRLGPRRQARTMTITGTGRRTSMGWATAALVAATITTGLVAGLFAAFSYAVMPGLAGTDAATFVSSMQRINTAILNPVFGLLFGGALVLGLLALVLHLRRAPVLPWVVAGVVLYVLVLVVTMALNVPLNDRLEAAGSADPGAARAAFEDVWVRWNVVRSVLSVASFGCLGWALVLHGRLAG
jgi:uncharacterized membrane protein